MEYKNKIEISSSDGNGSLDESLLDKMESKGADPHPSCRDGFCGSCRIKVLKGDVKHFKDPLGYHDHDSGERLACISKIMSDDAEIAFN